METVQLLKIQPGLHWAGVFHDNPHVIQAFMEAKYGSTCNSFLVQGSKSTVLFDVVAFRYLDGFLDSLKEILKDIREIDYIILNRTDPAHSSAVEKLLDLVPKIKVVGTEQAIRLLRRTMTTDFESIPVTTGSTLDLGNKTIKFFYAPFRYQQDTMFSYIIEDQVLLTHDAFSAHYCPSHMLLSNMETAERPNYLAAIRDYYHNVFGVSRSYVQKVMGFLYPLPVKIICPSHGPIIDETPEEIANLYRSWSEAPQKEGGNIVIAIPYMSDSEHTEVLLSLILDGLESVDGGAAVTQPLSDAPGSSAQKEKLIQTIKTADAALFGSSNISAASVPGPRLRIEKYPLNTIDYPSQKERLLKAIENADAVLFGSPTIHSDAAPPILDLVTSMNPVTFAGKYLSAFGVYAWSNEAVRNILSRLDQLNGLVMDGMPVPFHALAKEAKGAYNFGKAFAEILLSGGIPPRRIMGDDPDYNDFLPIEDTSSYIWTCGVCTFRYRKETLPPPVCPACGAHHDMFFKDKYPDADFKSEEPIKLVIIGNGAASVTAAAEARRRNEKAEITIISEEAEDAYFRAELAKKLSTSLDLKNFYVRNEEWYTDKNIRLMRSTRASRIDSKTKEVTLAGGAVLKYDKLIIATGSSPYIPPIRDAVSKQGIFTLHNKGDMSDIREYAKECSKALVIGSGNLGLMTSLQLKRMGLEVEILEKAPRVLMKYVDEKGGHILEQGLRKMGIRLRTNCDIKAVIGEGLKATGVELEFGQRIRGDMIIFCTGVKPNTEIVKGLPLKVNRGLDVNENMRTLDSSIFACGDVAEYKGMVAGLWAAAVSQGRVAGANAVGDKLAYQDTVQPVIFNMPLVNEEYPDLDIDLSLFSVGYVENVDITREKEYLALEYSDPDDFIYHKFYFEAGHLIAAILMGDVSKAGLVFRSVINEIPQNDFLHDYYR